MKGPLHARFLRYRNDCFNKIRVMAPQKWYACFSRVTDQLLVIFNLFISSRQAKHDFIIKGLWHIFDRFQSKPVWTTSGRSLVANICSIFCSRSLGIIVVMESFVWVSSPSFFTHLSSLIFGDFSTYDMAQPVIRLEITRAEALTCIYLRIEDHLFMI